MLWYLKEIMGENAYIHYLESYERRHGTREGAMGEREFWRDITDEQDRNPKARCC
ncbi:YbdD/YjiX family protein [Brevibacterium casei]|nr:YbdD/YjiX family protein [Brevibacterium casei]MCT2183765.1 YbdD/YjiX family protein [Brevibacterium casei]MCT2358745.1 YbdD/YjiX family protein [Brevibacterium casei]